MRSLLVALFTMALLSVQAQTEQFSPTHYRAGSPYTVEEQLFIETPTITQFKIINDTLLMDEVKDGLTLTQKFYLTSLEKIGDSDLFQIGAGLLVWVERKGTNIVILAIISRDNVVEYKDFSSKL